MISSTDQMTAQQNLRRPLAWVIWSLAVIYVIYKFQTQSSYAVLNSSIAESLSLTLSQVAQLGAVYAITYAVMTIPAGGLLDRYGARIVLSAGIATVAMGGDDFRSRKEHNDHCHRPGVDGYWGRLWIPGSRLSDETLV